MRPVRPVRPVRLLRLSLCIVALACAGALCGPEARLGDECNTSIDCGLELECTVVDLNDPDRKSCELVCTTQEECDEVFGIDTSIGCLEPTLGIDIAPGQVGRCMHYAGL